MLNTILGIEECRAKITKIRRVGEVLQANVHAVAVGTLAHAAAHGDVTVAADLLNALPSGQRVKALVEWYRHFSSKQMSLYVDKKTGSYVGKMVPGWSADKFRVEDAKAVSYGDLTKEKNPAQTIDLKAVRGMLARIVNNTKANADGSLQVTERARSVSIELVQLVDKAIRNGETGAAGVAA